MAFMLFANTVFAATNENANYTSRVSSYSDLASRLDSLINKYQGTYWTTDGKAANSSGSTSKYYYGIQCKGFANYIFNDLFCTGNIGAYDSNKYYIPSPNSASLVGKSWDFSSTDTATVKSILSKGYKGDFIQTRRRGKTYGHSMILVEVTDTGVWLFDCNSDGACGVKYYFQTWATFASKNSGMSLYHSTVYPQADGCSCTESYAGEYVCTTTSSNLIIRSTHGTSGNLGTIPPGATVTVTKANGEWAHVEYNGVSGYASMAYLQKKEENLIPIYALDELDGGLGTIHVRGWAFDDNAPTEAVDIHIYVGGKASADVPCYVITANQERTDIGSAYPGRGNYHGFDTTIPVNQYGDVEVTIYAINIGGDNHPMVTSQTVHITKPPALADDFPDDFYARIANNATKTLLTNDEKGDGMGSYEVVFSAAENTEAQIWHFTKNSNGSYCIVPLCDETIFLHAHAASNTPGTHVITTPIIPDAASQQWWIYKEDGLYYMRPGCADTCFLDLPGASSANGVRAQINTYNTEGGEGLLIETVQRSTIRYSANGGAGAPDTQYKMQGMEMLLSTKVPTRAGYTFLGWAESGSAVSAAYQPGGSFTKDKDVTLYAVWKQNTVQPTNDAKLTLTSTQTSVQPGKTFTVEVGVTNNPGVAAMTILVDYDESIMTLTGITSSSSMQVVTAEDAPNKAVLLNMTGDVTEAQKSLAVLAFAVKEDASAGQTSISVSCEDSSNFNAELVEWQGSEPLQLLVHKGLLGDVNSDGKLSTQDVILLSRYVLSANSVKIDTSVADMNGDGRINSQDIVLLCQAVLKVS